MSFGRFTLRQFHSAAYVRRLVGALPLGRAGQWLHWNTKKLGKRLGGSAWLRLREARFSRSFDLNPSGARTSGRQFLNAYEGICW
jgi:hypothetical protein